MRACARVRTCARAIWCAPAFAGNRNFL